MNYITINWQYLINQVLESQGELDEDDYDPDDDPEDPDDGYYPMNVEQPNNNKDLKDHPLSEEIMFKTGCAPTCPNVPLPYLLIQREHKLTGIRNKQNKLMRGSVLNPLSNRVRNHVTQRYIPESPTSLGSYNDAIFCSIFNKDGSMFMTACKDSTIRLYDTSTWKETKAVIARDVGWSIISTDFSPDGNWLIYSSWNDFVHIANTKGDHETHEALNFQPNNYRFCLFSIQFSPDNREIIGGSSDSRLYIYDLDTRQRVHRVPAHRGDVNAVTFLDKSSQTILSGSDDCLIKLWDKRTLNDNKKSCVGIFRGHSQGITFIDSKQDGRYFISNGKDHRIKLWDIRNLKEDVNQNNDQSIMTYQKHKILQTLIRCRFSPESTGQRYIYTGSYSGAVYIYDVITGDVVAKLNGHRSTVRDLHWHPTKPMIMTSSWDTSIIRWDYNPNDLVEESED